MRTSLCLLLVCVIPREQPAHAGCSFVFEPKRTLGELVDASDVVTVVKWVSTKPVPRSSIHNDISGEPGETIYEVIAVWKDTKNVLKNKKSIVVDELRSGKPDELLLLTRKVDKKSDWYQPIPMTQPTLNYLKAAPSRKAPWDKRLGFYLSYLENSDWGVSNDAHMELLEAPFEEIQKNAPKLPREKLRRWLADEDTPLPRIGLYGQILGACGNPEDAQFLEDIIKQPVGEDFRLGIDGIMGGYLLLSGEKGLKLLEDTKLKPSLDIPFSETYAAMQAIRFAWDHGDNIEKDRLKKSIRILLDRPEVADLVIADLAKWKDWEVQDRLMTLYDDKDYDIPSIKRAIVRFLLVCTKDAGNDKNENSDKDHAKLAEKHLETLRKKDPETVKQAERFFDLYTE